MKKCYGSLKGFQYYIKPKPFFGAYAAMENYAHGLLEFGAFQEYHTFFSDQFFDSLTMPEIKKAFFSHDTLKVRRLRSLLDDSPLEKKSKEGYASRSTHTDALRKGTAFDIIHFEQIMPHQEVVFRKLLPQKNIPFTRCAYTISTQANLRKFLDLCLLNNGGRPYDSIVVPSKAAQEVVKRYFLEVRSVLGERVAYKGRVDVIPHAIDTGKIRPGDKLKARKKLGLPPEIKILLSTTRITKYGKVKYNQLLSSLHKLFETADERTCLLIAGSDESGEARQVIRIAEELGIAEQVRVIANFGEELKNDIYNCADIFISFSDNLQESFGIALIEAMSSGLPVICTDWDGHKDIVEEGKTGYRVPVEWKARFSPEDILACFDDPYDHSVLYRLSQDTTIDSDYFVRQVMELLNNDHLRMELGRNGRVKAEQVYSLKVLVNNFESLWEELAYIAKMDTGEYKDFSPVMHYDYPNLFSNYPTKMA